MVDGRVAVRRIVYSVYNLLGGVGVSKAGEKVGHHPFGILLARGGVIYPILHSELFILLGYVVIIRLSVLGWSSFNVMAFYVFQLNAEGITLHAS